MTWLPRDFPCPAWSKHSDLLRFWHLHIATWSLSSGLSVPNMCSGTKSQSKNGGIYQLKSMVRYCAFVCLVEAKETANVLPFELCVYVGLLCWEKNTCQHAECYIVTLSIWEHFYCNPLPQCFSTDKSFIVARQTDKISEVSIDTVHHSRLNKCVQFSNLGLSGFV